MTRYPLPDEVTLVFEDRSGARARSSFHVRPDSTEAEILALVAAMRELSGMALTRWERKNKAGATLVAVEAAPRPPAEGAEDWQEPYATSEWRLILTFLTQGTRVTIRLSVPGPKKAVVVLAETRTGVRERAKAYKLPYQAACFDTIRVVAPPVLTTLAGTPARRDPRGEGSKAWWWALDKRYLVFTKRKGRPRQEAAQKKPRAARPSRAAISDELRQRILRRDNRRCRLCGRSEEDGVKLHVDHVLPASKGGAVDAENLQTLCGPCNMGKGNRDQTRW